MFYDSFSSHLSDDTWQPHLRKGISIVFCNGKPEFSAYLHAIRNFVCRRIDDVSRHIRLLEKAGFLFFFFFLCTDDLVKKIRFQRIRCLVMQLARFFPWKHQGLSVRSMNLIWGTKAVPTGVYWFYKSRIIYFIREKFLLKWENNLIKWTVIYNCTAIN
jgi:hypothetical protein